MNSDINGRQIVSKKHPVPSKKKHKVIIVGDSHVKGLSGASSLESLDLNRPNTGKDNDDNYNS
jgi:hypothetical protein